MSSVFFSPHFFFNRNLIYFSYICLYIDNQESVEWRPKWYGLYPGAYSSNKVFVYGRCTQRRRICDASTVGRKAGFVFFVLFLEREFWGCVRVIKIARLCEALHSVRVCLMYFLEFFFFFLHIRPNFGKYTTQQVRRMIFFRFFDMYQN